MKMLAAEEDTTTQALLRRPSTGAEGSGEGQGAFVLRFKCGDVFSGRLVNDVGRMAPH